MYYEEALRERVDERYELFDSLVPRDADIVRLRLIYTKRFEDIAVILDLTVPEIQKHYDRGLLALLRALGDDRKPLTGKRRYAESFQYQGVTYGPLKPSRFIVGEDSWIPDEQHLRVYGHLYTGTVTVCAPYDPQILFPSPEKWVRMDQWGHLQKNMVDD